MIINQANLGMLFTGFKANFQTGFAGHTPQWQQIATEVPSTTTEEMYAWLGQLPNVREWLGERVVHGIGTSDYRIKNKPFELTIGVPRPNIEDDTYGIYSPMFVEFGRSTAEHPDRLAFDNVKAGFEALCYDKKPFFHDEHIVIDQRGKEKKVSNMQAGNGPLWVMLDLSRALKPFIHQTRKKFDFVAKTDPRTSDHVFDKNEVIYGTDGRCNAGYGFWQMAYGSKAPLTKESLRAARLAMLQMSGDHDRKLGIRPTHILVGPSNSDKARDILMPAVIGATTNVDQNLVKIIDTVWLD